MGTLILSVWVILGMLAWFLALVGVVSKYRGGKRFLLVLLTFLCYPLVIAIGAPVLFGVLWVQASKADAKKPVAV